ncbi:MAG: aminotransferase class V-fold PLP-dependent enzyme [Promethearchaeia archaeon]
MEIAWDRLRKDYFPALQEHNYLMAASSSPMNKLAYENGMAYFHEMHYHGDIGSEQFFEEIDVAREIVSEYINAAPHEIAFLINTSSGMNIVARLFENEKGAILYPSIEFPASIHIFRKLGYPCTRIKDTKGAYPLENIHHAVTDDSKYLVHTHVQSFNGFRQNLDALGDLCEENNLINIINATQSFGSYKLDVKRQKINILVANGLKWIGCGFGIGILYISQELIKSRPLPVSSWLSVTDPFAMDNENMNIIQETRSMDSFGGCPNFPALLAFKGGLKLLKDIIGKGNINTAVSHIQDRIIMLSTKLVEGLKECQLNLKIITPQELDCRSGIITVEFAQAEKLYEYLVENNTYVTLKQYPKAKNKTLLRFAINYYNNETDIEKALVLLDAFYQ